MGQLLGTYNESDPRTSRDVTTTVVGAASRACNGTGTVRMLVSRDVVRLAAVDAALQLAIRSVVQIGVESWKGE